MTSPPASPSLPHERSELQHEEQQRSSDQTEKVTELCRRLKCELLQANGQRILGPPSDWVGPPPLKGSEVFVGRLPRDLLEDELVPVFERIGKIYQVRIMMDFR